MGAECQYELAQAAYVKLTLHALKHPASAVNGLLIGRLLDGASSPAVVAVVEAVPLSHSRAQPRRGPLRGQGLAVVGYYHANALRGDADLPAIAKCVGDHIFRYFPRVAVLLVSVASPDLRH
ncbi:hypothetical protein GUJ93_ZPchr0002g23635 [Zizania palustris]|uniref:MPN domain-containing protein n=1 Tax=Zizania palustris TaxID=103762 RepID=A0A8J5V5K3_ZIZPA|nr:hypothetical protein GUJ93_ZPchr0002g23635 [Zizania palustris]